MADKTYQSEKEKSEAVCERTRKQAFFVAALRTAMYHKIRAVVIQASLTDARRFSDTLPQKASRMYLEKLHI